MFLMEGGSEVSRVEDRRRRKAKAKASQGTKAIIDFDSFATRLAALKGFPPLRPPFWAQLMFCDLSNRKEIIFAQ